MLDFMLLLFSFVILAAIVAFLASMRDVPNPNCFNEDDTVESKCPFMCNKNDQRDS